MKILSIIVVVLLVLGISLSEAGTDAVNKSHVVPQHKRVVPALRIIGGNEAIPHAYPYQAALTITGIFSPYICGGSLISPTDILTAAHCLDGATSVMVYLGSHNLKRVLVDGTTTSFGSSNFILHDNWNPETLENDIAIIKLPKRANLNSFIKFLKIDLDGTKTHESEIGNLTGWGMTSDFLRIPPSNLRVLEAKITSNEVCKSFKNFAEIIKDSHLCADANTLRGSCNGDSGGPLVIDNVQVGIVSFGYELCETPAPSVYTRISYFAEWILEHSDIEI